MNSSLGSMARPTLSPSGSRSFSMVTMKTRHRLRHCPPHLRVPAFSPRLPRQANHFCSQCLRYRGSRLLQHRHSTSQSYDTPWSSTSCHPSRAFSTSNRCVYYHFPANLCWVSTYDHPRVSPSIRSPSQSRLQVRGEAHGGKDTSQCCCRMPEYRKTRIRGRGWRGVLVLHRPSLQISSSPGHAYTRDRTSESRQGRAR